MMVNFFRLIFFIFGPKLGLRGLNIVFGRREYDHSIRHEIFPLNNDLTFLLAQILIFRSNLAFLATLRV